MIKVLIAVLALVAVGLGASLWLIPRTPELALINYKDKRFEEARQEYQKQFEQGQVTPEVVNALVNLDLQAGDVNQAIGVMERYVAKYPADIGARRRLGQLYQYAERPEDYLRNLEEISRLHPTPETYEELSRIYNYTSRYDKQVEALKALIALQKQGNPQNYIDLADILAARQNRTEAINTLLQMKEKYPNAFTFRQMELLVSLLLDEHRAEEAYALSLSWRQNSPPPREVARLVNLLHYKGGANYGMQLLNTYDEAAINADPYLLQEKVLLLLEQGKQGEAYARLKELYHRGKLEPALQNRLLFLAVAQGDEPTTRELLKNLDMKTLNESEALTLLEMSLARGDMAMQRRLQDAFSAPQYQADYPALTAMLALASHEKEAPARLEALTKVNLPAGRNLQIARICMRLKDFSCTQTFLDRLPPPDQLDDAELASVANLYFDLKAYDTGYRFLAAVEKKRDTPELRAIRVKFLAVQGDRKAVAAWLDGEGKSASERRLADLYFAAYNHHRSRIALLVAERAYQSQPGTETRSMLAAAYIATGDNARAVALLRGAKALSAADESNYLTALTRLARTQPEYRRELGAYAEARLHSNLPYPRKMALIYALINAGEADAAMPYIRPLALRNGGQWAWLYADQLTREGRYEEARQFWLTLSREPNLSREEQRAIAYNLLKGGDEQDALPVFQRLAENAPPQSPDSQELLYLWGPRLNAEELDWLARRYDAAPTGMEKQQWGKIIAQSAGDEEITPFAEQRHPETLYSPQVLNAYLAALARTGELKEKHRALLRGIAEQGNTALLGVYAKNAQAFGYRRQAREAYQALLKRNPADNDALKQLGVLAFSEADYTASRVYLEEYIRSSGYKSPEDIATVSYYYAELLRHAHDLQARRDAAIFYRRTVQEIDAHHLDTADMLSKKAQSEIWLGDADQGLAVFHYALSRYPADDVLRADYISSLIALKRYGKARAALIVPLQRFEAAPKLQALPIASASLMAQSVNPEGNEARLQFTDEAAAQSLKAEAENLPWVSYVSEGYRRLLIVAKPGYSLKLENVNGRPALAALPAVSGEAERQIKLRYELLAARIDLETGHVYAANERLNALMPEYPQDTQLMGFAANAAYYSGNTYRAEALLNAARPLAPENEDIALLDRDIRRAEAPHLTADEEWLQRGTISHEWITTLDGMLNVAPRLSAGFIAQDDHVTERNVRRADGRIGSFSGNAGRGQVFLDYHGNESWARAALFGNNDTAGGGLYYSFLNPLGLSGADVEYHRAYWEYVEGVLDDATRDRVSIWHEIKPDTRWDIRLEPALNRYNVRLFDDVAKSISLTGEVVYRPIENMPYLYIAYGLDAEYFRDKQYRTDALGTSYLPLPVRSREIHFLSLNSGYEFDDRDYAQGMLGYAYDRLGGSGPVGEVRFTHEINDQIDAQLRAYYGVDTTNTNDNMALVGGYVRWRF